jgi:hypothetical protein
MGASLSITGQMNQMITVDDFALRLYSGKETAIDVPKHSHSVLYEIRLYTPGKAILIESRILPGVILCVFNKDIVFGSWYDIEVIVHVVTLSRSSPPSVDEVRYLVTGYYMMAGKSHSIAITDIIRPELRQSRQTLSHMPNYTEGEH